jgi:16S rRNA (adenine1518-N6/adenine1519-N6)-dimethyltransferase
MEKVNPKKHLGQHFLTDLSIAQRIADSLPDHARILELGPGTGVLTQFLEKRGVELHLIEIDRESIPWLHKHFPALRSFVHEGDFLKMDLHRLLEPPFALIGNFPYNISSQIFFRVLDYKDSIPCVVGMVQKEVGKRITSGPGGKENGILSVLLQTWYHCEYLFTVKPGVFNPPPKVESGVIRLTRNERKSLPVEEAFFIRVVKAGFNQRRKTLRNALKSLILPQEIQGMEVFNRRAEELSVEEFIQLAQSIREAQS